MNDKVVNLTVIKLGNKTISDITDELYTTLETKVFTPIINGDIKELKIDSFFIEQLCEASESVLQEINLDVGEHIDSTCETEQGAIITLRWLIPMRGQMVLLDNVDAVYAADGYSVIIKHTYK